MASLKKGSEILALHGTVPDLEVVRRTAGLQPIKSWNVCIAGALRSPIQRPPLVVLGLRLVQEKAYNMA
jgi:hypothetical protein